MKKKEKVQIMCQMCGNIKEVFPSRSKQKYCSNKCKGIGMLGTDNKSFTVCYYAECSNQVIRYKSKFKQDLNEHIFCSIVCYRLFQIDHPERDASKLKTARMRKDTDPEAVISTTEYDDIPGLEILNL